MSRELRGPVRDVNGRCSDENWRAGDEEERRTTRYNSTEERRETNGLRFSALAKKAILKSGRFSWLSL